MSEMEDIIDFKVIKEDWNLYKLNDGTLLKTKYVLIKVRREGPDELGSPSYGLNSSNVIGIISPKKLLGPPSPAVSPKELPSFIVEDDVEFKAIKEDWNQYALDDGTILSIKLVLVKVARTSKFDSGGDPLYLVNTQPIVKPSPRK